MNRILIVVDVQNDFIDGALGSNEAKAILPKVKEKIERYIQQGDAVVFTRDTHLDETYFSSAEGKKLPIKHCVKGTTGWQIGLETIPGTYEVVDKDTFGYFSWQHILDKYVYVEGDGTRVIELCGLDTDICVITNALIIKTLYPYPDVEVTVVYRKFILIYCIFQMQEWIVFIIKERCSRFGDLQMQLTGYGLMLSEFLMFTVM